MADLAAAPPASARALRRRPRLLPSLALNVVAFGVLYLAYSTIRTFTADSFRTARGNADKVITFQEWIGLPSEASVQSLLLDQEWLIRGANVYYLSMHFPSMIVFLLAIMLLRRDWMPRVRLALISSTLVGLIIHLAFPLAPPRMFGGFVDTARIFGPDPYDMGIAEAANQLAAMPSMHVGWALLIAIAVVRIFHRRWRWIVVAHPVLTIAVVVVTANHYWTDVVVGGLLGFIGWWIVGYVRPGPRPGELVGDIDVDEAKLDAATSDSAAAELEPV